jgi:hypothetical protein
MSHYKNGVNMEIEGKNTNVYGYAAKRRSGNSQKRS